MSLLWKILVFDEGTESAVIAMNENILLLDEYSKVKLFLIPPSLKISESSSNGSYRNTDEVW
jgi:hypothetical protein